MSRIAFSVAAVLVWMHCMKDKGAASITVYATLTEARRLVAMKLERHHIARLFGLFLGKRACCMLQAAVSWTAKHQNVRWN